ncbi:secreted RxLR effector protein 161-like [Cryptomeria japonica]|uniref:secreted RxLR effector protein 161-like n=1 Tax=Cryptomeria japonica TaxID=3369 RepID=UPI0027D9FA4C|nr:secreted RxLR effector protein 161-like [Cryptomeria japonica]
MDDCHPVNTPMMTGCKLSKSNDSPGVSQSEYRSIIGSLLYLTTSRPYLMQDVYMVSRFQYAPKQSHLNVVKRIFKYIQGTIGYGLWYPKNNDFTLMAFTDVDWASCLDEKKSTSGGAFFLDDYLVAWHSKKQDSVSLSTTEAEYIATTSCCTQLLWMAQTLSDMGINVAKPIPILCDNTSAINLSKNLVMHSCTKHIAIKFHFLREKVLANEVFVQYVPTQAYVAYIFTKPLSKEVFEQLRSRLGVVSQSLLV